MKYCALIFLVFLAIGADAVKRNKLCRKILKKLSNLEDLIKKKQDCCTPEPTPSSSCKEIYEKDCTSPNKAYNLKLGNQNLPVYCSMSGELGDCGGGGWTLVMKIDGAKHNFNYDSSAWSSRSSVSPENGDTGLDNLETLLPTYWSTSFTKICLGMKVNGVNRFLRVDQKAASLYALIADGQYRATSLGRDAWKRLVGPAASLQQNCNREGFNTQGSSKSHAKMRIGIIANEQNECNSPDSSIGFGGWGPAAEVPCGNVARHGGDNGDQTIKAFGYIFVQ